MPFGIYITPLARIPAVLGGFQIWEFNPSDRLIRMRSVELAQPDLAVPDRVAVILQADLA